jgi:hypothetical protein
LALFIPSFDPNNIKETTAALVLFFSSFLSFAAFSQSFKSQLSFQIVNFPPYFFMPCHCAKRLYQQQKSSRKIE